MDIQALSEPLRSYLLGTASEVSGGLAGHIVVSVISGLRAKIRAGLAEPEPTQALRRCVATALHAGLAAWDLTPEEREHYSAVFDNWIRRPAVVQEFALVIVPRADRELDVSALREEFLDAGRDANWLGKISFDELMRRMVEAFQVAASGEAVLLERLELATLQHIADRISTQTDLTREIVDLGRRSQHELSFIREASERGASFQGDVAALLSRIHDTLEHAASDSTLFQRQAYRDVTHLLTKLYALEIDEHGQLQASAPIPRPVNEILHLLVGLKARLGDPDQPNFSMLEQDYRSIVQDMFHYLTFRGLSETGRPIALPLADVYVELKLVADVPEAADTFSAEERRLLVEAAEDDPTRRAAMIHLDALRAHRWKEEARRNTDSARRRFRQRSIRDCLLDGSQRGLVILGDPGSGKTTLLHYLAYQAAADAKSPLPIFLPLAAYDDYLRRSKSQISLPEFLPYYYHRWQSLPGLAPLFQRALDAGQAFLLLDGLDEVLDSDSRRFVANQASAFIRHSTARGNRFVLTSRIVGYREAPLEATFPHVTVVDFGPTEISSFARQWCRAYEAWVAGSETVVALERARRETRALLSDLHSNPGVERLAANPLLLTMLALLRRQGGRLPERRIELYEKYVSLLVNNWEPLRSEGSRQERVPRFDSRRAIALLIDIALWLQQHHPSGTARRSDLERALADICLRYDDIPPEKATLRQRDQALKDADAFLKDVREFTGMLGERGRDAYGFLHLTFQEYFVGRAIALRSHVDRLALIFDRLHDPRWREPILLCAGRLGVMEQRRADASLLAQTILEAASPLESDLHRDLFLCAAIAADDVGLSSALLADLTTRLSSLMSSAIPTLRISAIRALAALAGLGQHDALDAVRRALRDPAGLSGTLTAIAHLLPMESCSQLREDILNLVGDGSHRADVQDQILAVLSPLIDSHVGIQQALLAKLAGARRPSFKAALLGALSAAASNAPDVRTAILSHLADPSADVRQAAAEATAACAVQDDDTRERLLGCLRDRTPRVRAAALQALGSSARDDAVIRDKLIAIAQDGPRLVRHRAIEALADAAAVDSTAMSFLVRSVETARRPSQVLVALEDLPRACLADDRLRTALLRIARTGDQTSKHLAVDLLSLAVKEYPDVRDCVLATLSERDINARAAAARALSSLAMVDALVRDALLPCLSDPSDLVRRAAFLSLLPTSAVDPRVDTELARQLSDDRSERSLGEAAICLRDLFAHETLLYETAFANLLDARGEPRPDVVLALARSSFGRPEVERAILGVLRGGDSFTLALFLFKLPRKLRRRPEIRDALVGLLGHPEPFVRGSAVVVLGAVKDVPKVRKALTASLSDRAGSVRADAIETMAPCVVEDEALRARAIACLADRSWYVRARALRALAGPARQGCVPLGLLQAGLTDKNRRVRAAAISAVWKALQGRTPAAETVLAHREDRSPRVRAALVRAVARSTDSRVRDLLYGALKDPSARVRRDAVRALSTAEHLRGGAREAVAGLARDSSARVRVEVARLGGHAQNNDAVGYVLQFLGDGSPRVRRAAILALGTRVADTPRAREAVMRGLQDDVWSVRASAVRQLLPLLPDSPHLVGELLPWLGAISEGIGRARSLRRRVAAAYARAAALDSELKGKLLALLDHPAWPMRQGAAWALTWSAKRVDSSLLPVLVAFLQDSRAEETWAHRIMVADGFINDLKPDISRAAIDTLTRALDYAAGSTYGLMHSSSHIRRTAASSLGRIEPIYQDPGLIERLRRILREDPSEWVRDGAYVALVQLSNAPEQRLIF